MHAARRWRPAGGSDVRWVSRRVEIALRQWFERWIATPTDSKVVVTCGEAARDDLEGDWWCADEHACLRVADQFFSDDLVMRALDLVQCIQVERVADREVVERLHNAMVSDLLAVLSDSVAHQGHKLTFLPRTSVPGDQRFSQVIQAQCFVESAKPWLEFWIAPSWLTESFQNHPLRSTPAHLVSIHQAVLDSRVDIDVNLGRCVLSARELLGLSVGDVLCTDQNLKTDISLELRRKSNEVVPVLGKGTPGECLGRAAISITQICSDPRP